MFAPRPSPDRTIRILGTHGVPANYGGFETAAENVGLRLAESGWRVIVYCQLAGTGPVFTDEWNGLERVNIPVPRDGWLGTSQFDLRSVRHALGFQDICLTFGYNTAVFNIATRLKRVPHVINMDGIEWSRSRWGKSRQAILYANERIACWVGNELIADHPEIANYLATKAPRRKLSTITYGADAVSDASDDTPRSLGLESNGYLTLICRPIPENSILELVEGFSRRARGVKLLVLGNYDGANDHYHAEVLAAASDEVLFPGAIYEPERTAALRFHSRMYLHGHTVGGTNPSLVEAMAAGNPVLAHDNAYNRWVAGDRAAAYFRTANDVADHFDRLLPDLARLAEMGKAARVRHAEEFTWEHVAGQYQALISKHLDRTAAR